MRSPWHEEGVLPAGGSANGGQEAASQSALDSSSPSSLPGKKQLIMLIGLPCSGKTVWAKKYVTPPPSAYLHFFTWHHYL